MVFKKESHFDEEIATAIIIIAHALVITIKVTC